MKLIAITIASVLALAVNAADLTLCDDAYFRNCATTTNVQQGECLSAAAQPQFNWPGFNDNRLSSYVVFPCMTLSTSLIFALDSYKQVNSGTGQCYYFGMPA